MFLYICTALGGLAMFLYGMQLMGEGLQKAAGDKLQKILAKLTGVVVVGVFLGALVTAILQSSSATTVMTVSLVNAGLMTLKQAFGIVMGANIGTTITAQLIAFKLTDYVTLILFIGFLVQAFATRSKVRYTGQVLLGFGILMLGMNLMTSAAEPLHNYPGFVAVIARFKDQPLLGVVVGTCMTMVVQSSAATIGILMAMAGQGIIPLEGAIPVLFGDNIGTCITAVLAAARANTTAKKVALSHVLFNLIGCIIFLIFLSYFTQLVLAVSPADDIGRQIANAHSAFNILNTLIFIPLAGPFIKLVEKLLPERGEIISQKPVYLDDNMLATPSLALALAVKEVVRMGQTARQNVATAMEAIDTYDEAKLKYVFEHEPVVDSLEEAITVYLTKISETNLSDELSRRHTGLLHACYDIERVGDHAETLAKRARTMHEDGISFSPQAKEELKVLCQKVLDAVDTTLNALMMDDKELAHTAVDKCRLVKAGQKQMRKNHIIRLNEKQCTPQAGFTLLELLLNLKRISDHSKNIAQLIEGTF